MSICARVLSISFQRQRYRTLGELYKFRDNRVLSAPSAIRFLVSPRSRTLRAHGHCCSLIMFVALRVYLSLSRASVPLCITVCNWSPVGWNRYLSCMEEFGDLVEEVATYEFLSRAKDKCAWPRKEPRSRYRDRKKNEAYQGARKGLRTA